jgi:tetratricopeptide (TPR) repeat protein
MREFLKQFFSNPSAGAVRFQEWAGRRRSRRGRAHLARGAGLAKHGRFSAATLAFSAMIELDSSNAEGHHGHGVCQLGLGNFDIARDSFLLARDRAPLRDDIRNRLGLALRGLSLLQETTESFKRALVLRPGSGEALNNLADVLQARGLEKAAFTGFARTLAVIPTSAGAHSNLGGAYRDAGRFSEADDSYERALVLDPEHAIAHFSRSLLALLRGDFEAGWDGFEWRNRAKGFMPSADYDASQWHGGDIENKSIYVHAEQGLGDVLQFIRYIPALSLRCERVVLSVPETLRRTVSRIEEHADIISCNEPIPKCDVHSPLLSLPHAFKTREISIPSAGQYLWAESALIEKWQLVLASSHTLRVGLIWSAGARSATGGRRSIDLDYLAPLLADSRVRWISLQLPPQSEQISRLPEGTCLDLSALQPNMCETGAIIMGLDLVITVDTSIAHLAGALGCPVWVMLPHVPDWRWQLHREDSPWYDSMRLFRQRATGDWPSVVEALSVALNQRMSAAAPPAV